jgi:rubrerythrin
MASRAASTCSLALGLGTPAAFAEGGNGDGVTDVKILNYALTLERLEYEFYRRMLSRFSESQIENAAIFDGLGDYVRRTIHENLVRIREHEETHVETLVAVIKSFGGRPVPECEYNFGVGNVADFVRTARVLENTGVMAYDGAIAYIDRRALQTVGATIATVEARHASYLNLLNRAVPFGLRRAQGPAGGLRARPRRIRHQVSLRPGEVLRFAPEQGDRSVSSRHTF